ncbi:glycosyltransferase family 2 protein [Nibrella viscosa]
MKKVSIVIPVYNEARTVCLLLEKVLKAPLPDALSREIIIVNDASQDNTAEVIQRFMEANAEVDIRFSSHTVNQGKGAALQTGIYLATGDVVIIQDADLEYDPDEYPTLLKPIFDGKADVVYGSRFMGGNTHRVLFFWHSVGNKFLTLLSNILTDINLTDMETCYKVFRTDIIQSIPLKEKRFGFEPEVTAKIARYPGIRIYEVGISYYGRTYAEGKKINWKDGFRAIYCILKYNLFDRSSVKQPVRQTQTVGGNVEEPGSIPASLR